METLPLDEQFLSKRSKPKAKTFSSSKVHPCHFVVVDGYLVYLYGCYQVLDPNSILNFVLHYRSSY